MLMEQLFIPTPIDTNIEKRSCTPSEENEYTCQNEFSVDPNPAIVYVADIERYTLMIAHSYNRGYIKGSATLLQGFHNERVPKEGK